MSTPFITFGKNYESNIMKLGSQIGRHSFVYLGGLTDSFYSEDETNHRIILDRIGKELGIIFFVPIPKNRCHRFHYKLCWPQDNDLEVINTYKEILSDLENVKIDGWIGFSNGGYFLQELLHFINIQLPIITIGSAGRMDHNAPINVMIGINDLYVVNRAKNLGYKFIEYDGKHEIDYDSLKSMLMTVLEN